MYLFIAVFTVMAYGTVHQPVIAAFYLLSAVFVAVYAASASNGSVNFRGLIVLLPLLLLGVYALLQSVAFGMADEPSGAGAMPRTISMEPYHSQAAAVSIFVLCFISASFFGLLNSAERVKKYALFVTVFGSLYAFYAILQSVLSPDAIYGIYKPASAAPFGSFVNRHNFAAIMEMCIAFPVGLLFAGAVKRDKLLLVSVATAIMGTALLLSESRGGLVSLIAMVLFMSLISSSSNKGKGLAAKLALSVALLITAVGGAVFVGGETSLTRFGDSVGTEDISSYRSHIWQVTLDIVRDNFPLGAGIGAFGTAYAQKDTSGGDLLVEHAHNDYLQVAADAGVVGVVLGLGFLVIFARNVRRGTNVADAYLRGIALGASGACFAILVHSMFDFVLHITAVAVMFLGCLMTLSAVNETADTKPAEDISEQAKKGSVRPFKR
jgi:O-antigen ligase